MEAEGSVDSGGNSEVMSRGAGSFGGGAEEDAVDGSSGKVGFRTLVGVSFEVSFLLFSDSLGPIGVFEEVDSSLCTFASKGLVCEVTCPSEVPTTALSFGTIGFESDFLDFLFAYVMIALWN